MSLPVHFLRPAAQGFAIGLLIAVAGCGISPEGEPKQKAAAQTTAPVLTEPLAKPASAPPMALREESAKLQRSAGYVAQAPLASIAPAPMADLQQPGYVDVPREQYQNLPDNPIHAVAQDPVSTFSIDVDTGSYANVRRLLNEGRLPPKGAVRLEEMVNYFPYDYALPSAEGSPFGITTELAPTPWNPNTRLLRVGIKASDRSVAELPPANLVFLVDVSGSMDRREGLPLVKSTLKLLVDQLRDQDKVSLVVYAGDSRPWCSSPLPDATRRASATPSNSSRPVAPPLAPRASSWPTGWRRRAIGPRASTASCWPPTATSTSASATSKPSSRWPPRSAAAAFR